MSLGVLDGWEEGQSRMGEDADKDLFSPLSRLN